MAKDDAVLGLTFIEPEQYKIAFKIFEVKRAVEKCEPAPKAIQIYVQYNNNYIII